MVLISQLHRVRLALRRQLAGIALEIDWEGSGVFSHVARSRYEKMRATRSIKWDLSVPTIDDLKKLSTELHTVAHALNDRLADLWDIDEGVQSWRRANNI